MFFMFFYVFQNFKSSLRESRAITFNEIIQLLSSRAFTALVRSKLKLTSVKFMLTRPGTKWLVYLLIFSCMGVMLGGGRGWEGGREGGVGGSESIVRLCQLTLMVVSLQLTARFSHTRIVTPTRL